MSWLLQSLHQGAFEVLLVEAVEAVQARSALSSVVVSRKIILNLLTCAALQVQRITAATVRERDRRQLPAGSAVIGC